jgi:hypothetical protein
MADPARKQDRELEEFRGAMTPPATFEEGFNWTSLAGAIFIGLFMVPGAIYMGLLAGQGIGPAAQWVTVILFIEVARRAQKQLKGAEIFVLFFMAGTMMAATAGGAGGLLWNQFFARSESATAFGLAGKIPAWFAPAADSSSYSQRSFLRSDWLVPIVLMVFQFIVGQLSIMLIGYAFFRATSDVEKLPFPMAPIGAQGVMALAEDVEKKETAAGERPWRWRVFAIGGAIGLAFGAVYLLLPTLTGGLTGKPVMLLPIPFSDFTVKTQSYLPAVATGMAWNLGDLIVGMVLPFWAMVGSLIGLVMSMAANPILYHAGVLSSWTPGDDTVTTLFKNNVDFYFSFGIGISVAIAIVGIAQAVRAFLRSARERKSGARGSVAETPKGRGDFRMWIVIVGYTLLTLSYILLSGWLVHWHKGVMLVLVLIGFVYTPLIGYVTTRLEGIAGQVVEIPMVREAGMILSGFRGIQVWFLPTASSSMSQISGMTVFYRQCELTGTSFRSIWKSVVALFPVILICTVLFSSFIWSLAELPSVVYPYSQKMWELSAANSCVVYSSTTGDYSIFEDAFKWSRVLIGTGFGTLIFGVLTHLGAPIFLVYGLVRGLGQSLPHIIIPQFIGALIGRYYFRKKLGLKWRQYVPVVAAGFACGMGLVATVGVGITFLSKAVVALPY